MYTTITIDRVLCRYMYLCKNNSVPSISALGCHAHLDGRSNSALTKLPNILHAWQPAVTEAEAEGSSLEQLTQLKGGLPLQEHLTPAALTLLPQR